MNLMICAFGPDKKGIVEKLSDSIQKQEFNIGESRMVILGDHFSILMLVSGEQEKKALLESCLSDIADLQVTVKEVNIRKTPEGFLVYNISVMGPDTPGIVHAVTAYLTAQKANVNALDSWITNAPNSGTEVFNLEMVVEVPVGVNFRLFREGLYKVCDIMNLDADVESAN